MRHDPDPTIEQPDDSTSILAFDDEYHDELLPLTDDDLRELNAMSMACYPDEPELSADVLDAILADMEAEERAL